MARLEALAEQGDAPWLLRWRWARRRWPPLLALAVGLPVAAVAIHTAGRWPGSAFPGFFLMGNRLVPTIRAFHWPGLARGVRYLDRLVSVDGIPAASSAAAYRAAAGYPPGSELRYGFADASGAIREVQVPTMTFGAADYWLTVGIFLVCGVLSLGLGVVVGLLQPGAVSARAFFLQGSSTGLYALTGTTLYAPETWWLSPLYFLAHAVVPATFIHLVLVFPVARAFVQRRPAWLLLPYGVAAAVFASLLVAMYAEPPDPRPLLVSFWWFGAGLAAFIGVPLYTFWENRTPRVRRQLWTLVPGIVLGTATALWAHVRLAAGEQFPLNLMALAVPIFYAAIAWAIVRHDAFEIDRVLKIAMVYGLSLAVLYGGHATFAALIGALAPAWGGSSTGLFLLGAVLVFEPLRRRVQSLVEPLFYRRRVSYRATVKAMSADLTSLLHRDRILDRVATVVAEGLQVESLAIVVTRADECTAWRWDASRRHLVPHDPSPELDALCTQLAADTPHPWKVVEADAGIPGARLIVPMPLGGRVVGALILGRRRSGREFSRDDLDLLGTVAAQSAVALENARSYAALEALNAALEQKVRERTGQLEASMRELEATQAQLVHAEKMASLGVLVAGVAHEINNPVAAVVNNIAPLRDVLRELADTAPADGERRTADLVAEAQEIVAVMQQGAERTAGVVQDLRTFSRMGGDQPVVVDLRENLEIAVRLLHPRWADRIAVHWDIAPYPMLEAVAGQLNQVFMNVLANACDAIEGKGNIWIAARGERDGVLVSIRDDGRGIAPEQASRSFEPFFTTKPPGKGTGLGLAVAHGIVAAHGGTIALVPSPPRGAECRVWLPCAAAVQRSEETHG